MTDTLKILGQAALAATTETSVYTVPASTQAIVSSLVVCNRGGTSTTFRLSLDQGGSGTLNKDYLYYDTTIPANDTFVATIGIGLSSTDVVKAYAGNANLSVTVLGVERT